MQNAVEYNQLPEAIKGIEGFNKSKKALKNYTSHI